MATLAQVGTLLKSEAFKDRVTAAVFLAAVEVLEEPAGGASRDQDKRIKWARRALQESDWMVLKIVRILAAVDSIAKAGDNVTDEQITTVLKKFLNSLAAMES